jgi:hypothetical protein
MQIYCTLKYNGKCSVFSVHNSALSHAELRESEDNNFIFLKLGSIWWRMFCLQDQQLYSQGKAQFVPIGQ